MKNWSGKMVSTHVVCTIMIARETHAEAQANRGGQCIVIIPPIPIKSRNEEAGVCLDFRGLLKSIPGIHTH